MSATTTHIIDTTPRVWVGCLACYNEGRLVGTWVNAEDAEAITPENIHGQPTTHEELWCFDHENIPVRGELDPVSASAWGRCLVQVADELRPALLAWVESGSYVAEGGGDLPSITDFEERYQGIWNSLSEYAENYISETGLLDGIPENVARYFDHEAFANDLMLDYTMIDAPDGIYVFRDM